MRDQDCEACSNYRYEIDRLSWRVRELEKDLARANKETDNFHSVKRERDELKAWKNRAYDNYISNPERGRAGEDGE